MHHKISLFKIITGCLIISILEVLVIGLLGSIAYLIDSIPKATNRFKKAISNFLYKQTPTKKLSLDDFQTNQNNCKVLSKKAHIENVFSEDYQTNKNIEEVLKDFPIQKIETEIYLNHRTVFDFSRNAAINKIAKAIRENYNNLSVIFHFMKNFYYIIMSILIIYCLATSGFFTFQK